MSNARLFWRFPSDNATTISASVSDYQLGADRLLESSPSSLFQDTTAAATVTVTLDIGTAAGSIQAFALLNHNFDGTETDVAIHGHTSDSWGAPAFSHTITHRASTFIECFTAAQTYQWWRLSYTKASAADVRSAGRLLLGPYYEMPRNITKSGFKLGWKDLSSASRTKAGVSHADIGGKLRTMNGSVRLSTEAQVDEMNTLAKTYGKHTPFCFLGDHENEPLDWFLYGHLARLVGQTYAQYDSGHLWNIEFSMEEAK